MESPRFQRQRNPNKLLFGVLASASALAIAGCGSTTGSAVTVSAKSTTEQAVQTTMLHPNMVRFLEPGTDSICLKGGARPCAILLRTSPQRSSPIINASPNQVRVNWPLEAYKTQPGDTLTIRCYTQNDSVGGTVHASEGGTASADWYQIDVPEQYVLNPVVKAELTATNSNLKTVTYDGHTALLGWASVEWFDQTTPAPGIPACAS